jgi:hypothetical protein
MLGSLSAIFAAIITGQATMGELGLGLISVFLYLCIVHVLLNSRPWWWVAPNWLQRAIVWLRGPVSLWATGQMSDLGDDEPLRALSLPLVVVVLVELIGLILYGIARLGVGTWRASSWSRDRPGSGGIDVHR